MGDICFSIIILSHNNAHISMVINSLANQCIPEDEIIIVDDHSDSLYLEKLKKIALLNNCQIIYASKRGNRSHSRNIGAEKAQNEILLFVDGDIVFIDNALNVLRRANKYRTEAAFIGPKHNIHYDELHFQLVSGMKNYLQTLQTEAGKKQLSQAYYAKDERQEFFADLNNRDFFWMHYYTGACSVEKSIFYKCGGFDESFETWGSEDVDLGYRIHQCAQIGFLNDFHSFHIPHQRNAFEIENTNMENILKMLNKYMSWEFEVLYSFNGHPATHKSFLHIISQMRTLSLSSVEKVPMNENSSMIIDSVSAEHPNGFVLLDTDGKQRTLTLLGLALPFASQSIYNIWMSDHIFIYPTIVTSRIIQEAIRVGKNVYIIETGENIRIDWSGKISLPVFHSNYRISYHSDDIMDYYFERKNGYIRVLSALPVNVMRSPIFWENIHVCPDDTGC